MMATVAVRSACRYTQRSGYFAAAAAMRNPQGCTDTDTKVIREALTEYRYISELTIRR
jgi:hypothetical protein